MPIYPFRCTTCDHRFDRLLPISAAAHGGGAACPACGGSTRRDYAANRVATPSIGTSGELSEDAEPYRAMHYHEKRGEWEQAAKAAEGVSDFARQKFIQKAEQD